MDWDYSEVIYCFKTWHSVEYSDYSQYNIAAIEKDIALGWKLLLSLDAHSFISCPFEFTQELWRFVAWVRVKSYFFKGGITLASDLFSSLF